MAPNLFVLTLTKITVVCELIQAADKCLYGFANSLGLLVKAGVDVMDDIPFGFKVFIKLLHHNLKVNLEERHSLHSGRKHN